MHGIEVEKLVVENSVGYIIPFVGKETPWWSGITNKNIYTGESFKMVPTVLDNITVEDIRNSTNVANIVVSKNPYFFPIQNSPYHHNKETKYLASNDVFYISRTDTQKVLNFSVSSVYEAIQHEEVLNRAEKLRTTFPDKLNYYSSGVLFNGRIFLGSARTKSGVSSRRRRLTSYFNVSF